MPAEPETPPLSPRGSLVSTVFAGLVALLMVGLGVAVLDAWIAPGTAPGARTWGDRTPVALLACLVVFLGAALLRRAAPSCWAMAATGWCIGVLIITELPLTTSAHRMGDGPFLVPIYLAITLGAGLYAVAGPRSHTPAIRAVSLVILFASCNGKLFTRSHEPIYPIFFGAAALALGVHGSLGPKVLLRSAARPLVLIIAAFVGWLLLASLLGESVGQGLSFTSRTLAGVLLAWALASCRDPRDGARGYDVVLLGLALCLVVVAAGVIQTASVCGWERTLVTRLRFFGQHPGLVAPFLAIGICLGVARVFAPRRAGSAWIERIIFAALTGVTAWVLVQNEARASVLGTAAGLAVLTAALLLHRLGRLPRRGLPLGVGLVGLMAVGLGAFLSPLGGAVRAKLEGLTYTSSAWGQRYHWWQAAARATLENPILGLGPRCEWARARLASSSHLDGQDQGTHAHNIFLSLSEGAGIPAAVLYLALVLGILELARRVMLREGGDRRTPVLAAGLAAAVVAVTTANLLSMGQAWKTLTPWFVWIALGLLGAMARAGSAGSAGDAEEERVSPLTTLGAGLLALVFFASPAISYVFLLHARAAAERGDIELSLERIGLARRIDPGSTYTDSNEIVIHLANRDHDAALEVAERIVARAPRKASSHLLLGNVHLGLGDLVRAKEAYGRAAELDPWGANQAEHLTSRARIYLLLGQESQARELLLEALGMPGTPLRSLRVPLPARPDDPEGLRRSGFVLGEPQPGDRPEFISLDSLLGELEADLFDLAVSEDPQDRTEARRRLGQLHDHRRSQGQGDQVLELFDRYAELVPERYSTVDILYVRRLVEAGRWRDAARVIDRHGGDRNIYTAYIASLSRVGGEEELAELDRAIREMPPGIGLADIWFQAGDMAVFYEARAKHSLSQGDEEAALAFLDAAIYDLMQARERSRTARRLLELAAAQGASNTLLLDLLDRVVHEASVDRRVARDEEFFADVAATLRTAWAGSPGELEQAVAERSADAGHAGATLRAALGTP